MAVRDAFMASTNSNMHSCFQHTAAYFPVVDIFSSTTLGNDYNQNGSDDGVHV
jgi:hypothetical protein